MSAKEWYLACKEILDNDGRKEEQAEMVHYLALLSLYMLRYSVKDSSSTSSHITRSSSKFVTLLGLTRTVHPSLIANIPPPHETAVKFWTAVFCPGTEALSNLLGVVVTELTQENIRPEALSVLRASCGTALAYNGLTAVNWFIRAAKAMDMTQQELLMHVAFKPTETFCLGIVNLLSEESAKIRTTFPYCRLFNNAYENCWAVSQNKKITALLVALTEGSSYPDDNAWDFPHLSSLTESDINWGIHYVKAIRSLTEEMNPDVGLTSKARKIIGRACRVEAESSSRSAGTMIF